MHLPRHRIELLLLPRRDRIPIHILKSTPITSFSLSNSYRFPSNVTTKSVVRPIVFQNVTRLESHALSNGLL